VWSRTAISVPEHVVLTAPTPPVPTTSTEQEHNHDDNQNRFYTHFLSSPKGRRTRFGRRPGRTDWPPCLRHLLALHRACCDPGSLKSLTVRGLSSLFKKNTIELHGCINGKVISSLSRSRVDIRTRARTSILLRPLALGLPVCPISASAIFTTQSTLELHQ
jgi:hypothetical protein